MISVTLARRYARALLHLAQRQKELDRTHEELKGIAAYFAQQPLARRYFESPNISRTEKVAFLESRMKPKVGRPVYGLLQILLRRRRLYLGPCRWPGSHRDTGAGDRPGNQPSARFLA